MPDPPTPDALDYAGELARTRALLAAARIEVNTRQGVVRWRGCVIYQERKEDRKP